MYRHPPTTATPCPLPPTHPRDSILSTAGDDTTANIEFTADFGGSLRNTRPRRQHIAPGKERGQKNALDFAIHEDAELGGRGGHGEPGAGRKKIALAQPARRAAAARPSVAQNIDLSSTMASRQPHASKSGTSLVLKDEGRNRHAPRETATPVSVKQLHNGHMMPQLPDTSRRLSGVPRRPPIKTERPLPSLPEEHGLTLALAPTTVLKPARRGTIFIPIDDTTMPSMYMGIFSPIKDLDARMTTSMSAESDIEMTGIAAQMAKKRHPRRSMMEVSPKRVPLHALGKNVQGSTVIEDRFGQGGGKENIPPGYDGVDNEKSGRNVSTCKAQGQVFEHDLIHDHTIPINHGGRGGHAQRFDSGLVLDHFQPRDHEEKKVSKLHEPTASSMGRTIDRKSSQRAGVKPTWNSGSRVKPSLPAGLKKTSPTVNPRVQIQDQVCFKKPFVPTRFIVPSVKTEPIADAYPILTEDLATPSMYEDRWLNHQEISITQLVNNLFEASSPGPSALQDGMLRIRLLERYGNAEHAMLYRRLQAALMFGALSVPSDILKGAGRLSSDIGRRKAFTDLWLETYNLSYLQAALEVVVGRQMRVADVRRSTGDSATRERLQRFIETFLIRNEDGTPDEHGTDRAARSYQRTMLRSLMLIRLLDITKSTSDQLVSGCLFQTVSPYKDSIDVVKALFQLLNPSAGDPIRALSHIGYRVTHSQYPLEEYDYKINNLAVDLRDGVRLTRLVELLLYPSASQSLEYSQDPNSTITVLLPTGELLSLDEGQQDWPLSQHLKLPCIGRATKLYNVQIALSALQGVRGMTSVIQEIKAEDVVDGYREKTVRLLWGLTSKWGLGGLVDWHDVEREIKRLCRSLDADANNTYENDFFDTLWHDDEDEDEPARYQMLLKSWAQAIAAKNGLVVTNLTTSFAGTRVFEAIVDEYEGYIIVNNSSSSSSSSKNGDARSSKTQGGGRLPLSARLRQLGCSEQFAGLFSTTTSDTSSQTGGGRGCGRIFDRDFVLAALAFLCSRLLEPSRGPRAAVVIQRAWQRHWNRVVEARKCRLKMMAVGCAEAVRQRRPLEFVQPSEYEGEGEIPRQLLQPSERGIASEQLVQPGEEGASHEQAARPDDEDRESLVPSSDDRDRDRDTMRHGKAKNAQIQQESDAIVHRSVQDADEEDIWLSL
ncbi:hypothetical protein A1O1_08801 [Capronia coronata CBS 617.96]|uniref:Calponin-homology (CH) domain-containing protein n=1 Tax=Capronia coronata CBS 617.96 TaxID=1182541 RepID=W9XN82_9EURO|nr:uncharacterized protein A1O1_08801 [Capronia coronata CBS 617.96]EXJ78401.1 hypothetical protein A1O1_08801 [Capronia coronata CBS 617.96]